MSDFDNSGVTEPQTTTPAEPAPQQTNVPPYQPAPEKPKKRFPKVLLIVAALLVIGAAAFFGIRAIAGGKPINKAALSMKKAVEAMEKNDNYAVLKSVGEAGSVNISVDLSKLGEVLPGGMELPVMINATSYTDAKNGKAALELDAQIKNKSIVNGTVLVSEDQLAVACDALLGKTPYSLDLKNIAKNLPKSFLDPNSDSDSALPEEVYDWLVSLKNGILQITLSSKADINADGVPDLLRLYGGKLKLKFSGKAPVFEMDLKKFSGDRSLKQAEELVQTMRTTLLNTGAGSSK